MILPSTGSPTSLTFSTPESLASTPDNTYVWAASVTSQNNSQTATLYKIRTADSSISSAITSFSYVCCQDLPQLLAIAPSGNFLYAAAFTTVEVVNTQSGTATSIPPAIFNNLTSFGRAAAVAVRGRYAYVADFCFVVGGGSQACVDKIDTQTNTVVNIFPLPTTADPPQSIAVSPNGLQVYVAGADACDGCFFAAVYVVDLSSGTVTTISFASPVYEFSDFQVVLSPDGTQAYATVQYAASGTPGSTLYVIDTSSLTVQTVPVGNGPAGLAFSPDGTMVIVADSLDTPGTVAFVKRADNSVTTVNVGTYPVAIAAMNPAHVPLINQPLVPDATPAGGSGFTLTVNGSGFVANSVVNWNGAALATTFVNGGQLTATVPASNIATATTASVTMTNPAPGGGVSNAVPFTVTSPTTTISLTNTTFPSGGFNPQTILSSDFNNDGKPDLAVLNVCGTDSSCKSGGMMEIFLGNGDGTFGFKSTFAVGSSANSAVVADLNRDGIPDLVVGNPPSSGEFGYTISAFLGNGDGTFSFAAPTNTVGGSASGTLISGDFNGDGNIDIAVPTTGQPGFVNRVCVYLGSGNGQFGNVQCTNSVPNGAGNVTSAVAGDFNGDGILDLAVAVSGSSDALTILLGNGDGTFTPAAAQPSPTLSQPNAIAVGDFNGDGILDLAIVNMGSAQMTILLGNGDGTFTQTGASPSVGNSPFAVATADVNGDENLDLVVTNQCGTTPGCTLGNVAGSVSILFGDGKGNFTDVAAPTVGNQPEGVVLSDFNGDGRLDLALTDYASLGVSILLQAPAVTLNPTSVNFGNQPVNTASASQQVTITNNGSAPLVVSSITIGGTNPGDFAQTNNCTTVLPTERCAVQVDFTPSVVGTRNATVSIADNAPGSPQSVSLTGVGVFTLGVTTASLPGATVGSPYNETLQATGGTLPYSWALTTGSVPPGISPSAAGVISGTPTTAGTYNFTVTVTDANGTKATSGTLTIVVAAAVSITTTTLPGATVGSAYSQTLQATGGTAPLTWTVSVGSLPPGISLSAEGIISGTPSAAGAFSFTVKVTDANGSTATQALSIAVLQITTTTLPNGAVGFAYSQVLQATGGTSPYVWTVSTGSLPVGLSLSSPGVISGTPMTAGTSNFTVMVTDAKGNTTTLPLSIVIVPSQPPTITTQPASQTINPQQTATLTVVATGAPLPTYQWYEGMTGDTSIKIAGATNSSYTTPPLTTNTSYWVQVSNGVSPAANSATATVNINLTCTLKVQGSGASGSSNPLSITATATCTDLPGQSFTTSIDWGDKTPPATGTGSLTASHTYAVVGTYVIAATATTSSETTTTASSSVTLVQVPQVPAVFPGQSSDFPLSLGAPAGPFAVTFECTTVTDSSGAVTQASDLGITCNSIPSPVTLPITPPPPNQPNVTITIATTGPATGSIAPGLRRGNWLVAMWLPLAALVLFGAGWRKPRLHRSGIAPWLAGGVLVILLLLFTSCGGGFTAPAVTEQATPSGNYQVTVVSQPAPGQTTTGFVQTSLIVPLSVSPTP